jgi:hypothetical protein
LKEAKDTPPATPMEPGPATAPTPSPTAPIANDAVSEVKPEPSPAADVAEAAPPHPEEVAQLQEAQQDIPQPSIEV